MSVATPNVIADSITTAPPRVRSPRVVPAGPTVESLISDRVRSRKNVRLALTTTIGFIVVFLLGDAILARIPLPEVYGSRNLALDKLALLDDRPAAPQVVFLGSSLSWNAIRPHVIDDALREAGRPPLTSANLAASSAGAWTQWLMIRRMIESGRIPKVAFLEVGPITLLNDDRPFLINGLRALGDVRDLPDAAGVSGLVFSESLAAAMFQSYHRWEDVNMMSNNLLRGAPLVPTLKLITDDRGWGEWRGQQQASNLSQQKESTFRAATAKERSIRRQDRDAHFRAATAMERSYPSRGRKPTVKRHGIREGVRCLGHQACAWCSEKRSSLALQFEFRAATAKERLASTELNDSNTSSAPPNHQPTRATRLHVRALKNAVHLLRKNGVAVRLLEMSTSSFADRRYRSEENDDYQALLKELTTDLAVPVLRAPVDLLSDKDFYDAAHLNPTGAEKFTKWLAGNLFLK